MSQFIDLLEQEFIRIQDSANAEKQKAYMRNQFEFFGLKAGPRREVSKPFLDKLYLPHIDDLELLMKSLWNKPEREFQMFALDLILKYSKTIEEKHLELFEYLIIHKSWWDTVDVVAVKCVGQYFKKFPNKRDEIIAGWLKSDNIWLQRTCLIFQLKYKTDLDTALLEHCIKTLNGTKEFFINKAIGWVLREYSRTDANWVVEFVENNELSNLSKKEALRLL